MKIRLGRKKRWLLLILLSGAGMFLHGCTCNADVVVTQDQNNGTIYILVGSVMRVELPADETNVCGWWVSQVSTAYLERIDADISSPGTRERLQDGTLVEVFRFQAKSAGPGSLTIEQRCNDQPSGTNFKITVITGGSGV